MLQYKNLLPKGTAGKKYFQDIKNIDEQQKKDVGKKNKKKNPFTKIMDQTMSSIIPTMEKDSLTRNIIQESTLLSKKATGEVMGRDNPLTHQSSFAEGNNNFTLETKSSITLGMSGLNFSPMKLRRVYGRTDTIRILNLTGIHKSHIVYAASNVIIFFDYYENRQSMLQGHKNKITCLAKDTRCQYFASGDVGKDSVIIIWDINTGFPYKTFPASHSGLGVISIGFIGHEEYVGTIGVEQRKDETEDGQIKIEELQTVCIWNFTHYGNLGHTKAGGHPEAFLVIPKHAGFQRDIVFDDDFPDYFVTTGNTRVVFYTWLRDEKKISCHFPKTPKRFMNRLKQFTQSIWMKTHNWCLTGTTSGYIVAWGTTVPLGLQEPPNPNLNIKEYKRSYKVGERAITALNSFKEFFVIGDDTGLVKFFDFKFRLVRWTKSYKLPPINCIEFNYGDTLPEFKEEMQAHYDRNIKPHAHRENISAVRDYTFGGEKYRQPSQTTIDRQPFHASDFVIGCEGGSVYYYHLAEGKVDTLIYGTPGQIVTLDTCPDTSYIAMSTAEGEIHMYDYNSHSLIFSGKIFKKAVEVTCMKFHPHGSFALFGMKTGQIYFRRSYTWKSMETPLDNCSSGIERIVFSDDGVYMSHWDVSNTVTLYFYNLRRVTWTLRGKHRSHFKSIVDLGFIFDETIKSNRLFSLGTDRCLIEYDIPNSTSSSGLIILHIFYAEQNSIPTSMVFDSPFQGFGPLIMYANTDNKIKIYDQNERVLRRCCQGPNYGTPINRMISITPDAMNGSVTKFILVLLGNKIGLMKSPVDGNPFKSMAVLGHPDGIKEAVVGYDQKEIFTCGNDDNCIFMWEPNTKALETCSLSGGSGVAPYMQMLDADLPPGKSLVQDVENIFYHLMLRMATSPDSMFNMDLEIPITEIHVVLRTCGFFPTEYQIDQMVEEAYFLGELHTGEKPDNISYEDFIRLFANHRTVPTLSTDIIFNAFEVLGELNDDDDVFLDRDKFTEYLTLKGESINQEDLKHFLPTFYRIKIKVDIDEGMEQPAWLQLASMSASEMNQPQDEENSSHDETESLLITKPIVGFNLGNNEKEIIQVDDNHIVVGSPGLPSSPLERKFSDTNYIPSSSFLIPRKSYIQGEDYNLLDDDSQEKIDEEEMELPEEITAKFFIEQLLPAEALDTINWELPKRDEEQHLNQIYSDKEWKPWEEIIQRWKGRDEWRYFKRVFEKFNDTSYPLDKKLRLAIEMDHYCKTGSWPGVRRPTNFEEQMEEEEGEGEGEGEEQESSIESIKTDKQPIIAPIIDILPTTTASDITKVEPVHSHTKHLHHRKSTTRRKSQYPGEEPGESSYETESSSEEEEKKEEKENKSKPEDEPGASVPVVPSIKKEEDTLLLEEISEILNESDVNVTDAEEESEISPPFTDLPITPIIKTKQHTESESDSLRKLSGIDDEFDGEGIDDINDWLDSARHSQEESDVHKKFLKNRSRAMSKKDFDVMVKHIKSREGSVPEK